MARVSLLNFDGGKHKGLWVMGPREQTPSGYLRRLKAIHSLREPELRSRNGTTVDASIAAAHSLTRFNDVRYQAATTVLYKAGISIDTAYDGSSLEFDVATPRSGTSAEYLFISGGSKLRKVDTTGTVTQWGIDAPAGGGNWGVAVGDVGTGEDSNEVTVGTAQTKVIIPTDGTFTGGVTFIADAFQTITIETTDVFSASGSAYCTPFNIAGTSEDFV